MSEPLIRYKALEEEGRQRASDRDKKVMDDDSFLARLSQASNEMSKYFRRLGEEEFSSFANTLSSASSGAELVVWKCATASKTRGDCDASNRESSVEAVDEASKRAIKQRCSFLRGVVSPYNLSSMLNDLTACFHRNIEQYEESARRWHKEGKCMWRV